MQPNRKDSSKNPKKGNSFSKSYKQVFVSIPNEVCITQIPTSPDISPSTVKNTKEISVFGWNSNQMFEPDGKNKINNQYPIRFANHKTKEKMALINNQFLPVPEQVDYRNSRSVI